ncbi:MAG: signal peptidase II [Alphaproteobacteria bacterium]|jgi:signal peptidase II|nr:signal peptidase II [Alphaproteobacteria bacterium]
MKTLEFLKKYKLYITIIIIGIIIDALTKTYMVSKATGLWMLTGDPNSISPDGILFQPPITSFFNLSLVFNKGVSFSMLTNHSELGRWLLFFMSIVITIFLVLIFKEEKNKTNRILIALAISGALGNAIDRLRFGAVVDFLDFHAYGHHWPSFNIADMLIVIGIGILVTRQIIKKDNIEK